MKDALNKLLRGEDLSTDEASAVMETIATGGSDPVQTSAFLVLLAAKGETAAEIEGLVRVMLQHAAPTPVPGGPLLDIVGTGGDGHSTVNISTAAAVLAAACGAKVAKHGNRSVSSKSGSADVLEELGVAMLGPEHIGQCIERCGVSFMFAPKFHPAMKYVVPVRRSLGVRTVFNILGPLLNPAGAKRCMLGVYDPKLLEVYGATLHALGVEHALVVHCCGLDELAAVGVAEAVEVTPAGVVRTTIDPGAMGIAPCTIEDLRGGDAAFNAAEIRKLFAGDCGRVALAETIALNAGAGLYVYGMAASVEEGYRTALATLKAGKAAGVLEAWAATTTSLAAAEPEAKQQRTA